MRVAVVINQGARELSRDAGLPGRIREAFEREAAKVEMHVVSGQKLRETAQSLIGRVDVVAAAGGDGTVSAVAGALAGSQTPLGVLPLGTLNHFAKDAAIPLDLEQAVRAIAHGRPRELDVAEVNGHVFVNNSALGLYPKIVRTRDERRRTGISKWVAMGWAIISVVWRFPLALVRLAVNRRDVTLKTPFVLIGNNRYELGLFNMGSRDRLDRGELSIFVAHCDTRASLAKLLLRALVKRLGQTRDVIAETASEVWVETKKAWALVAIDGEILRLESPLHYRILPRALRVMGT